MANEANASETEEVTESPSDQGVPGLAAEEDAPKLLAIEKGIPNPMPAKVYPSKNFARN